DSELQTLRTFFPDGYFGELIFLVNEAVLILHSHMGEHPIHAMHGYHPKEKQSYAALFTNQAEVASDIAAIPDLFRLMTRDAELAKARNGKSQADSEWLNPGLTPLEADLQEAGKAAAKLAPS